MTTDPQVSQGALDLRLGMQALDRDLITPEQLKEAMSEQARDAAEGRPPRTLAAILVARGYVTERVIEEMVHPPGQAKGPDPDSVRRQDLKLRELLLKEGVPQENLDKCAFIQADALTQGKAQVPRLAELMVDKGYATPEAISRILAVQKKVLLRCADCRRKFNVKNYYPLKDYRCLDCKGLLEATGELSRASAMDLPALRNLPLPGSQRLGKFHLVRELGKGGMGVVHEALDTQLRRKVALKLMITSPHADPEEVKLDEERFVRESQLSARLSHPNIVTVYEAGVIEGRRFIAMELVEGEAFSEWRKQGSITIRQQVSILRDVAFAVHSAHLLKILHRDLKPANILVDRKNQPHVMDFGLGKVVGRHTTLTLTLSGAIVGTPTYMSPEQAKGSKSIDARADIWSIGVMLYEILAGQPPFKGDNTLEVLMKVMKDPVVPPSRAVQGSRVADPCIESVCLKALAKKPEHRYATAEALGRDLSRWLKGESFRVALHQDIQPRRPHPRR